MPATKTMPTAKRVKPGDTVRDKETQRRFEDELAKLKQEAEAEVEEIRQSRILSDADFNIRINTLG